MSRKIAPADLENAIQEYVTGEGAEKVATRFHTNLTTLRSALKERNLWRSSADMEVIRLARMRRFAKTRRCVLPETDICARYLSGESEKSIADCFNVSRNVITRILCERNIERRSSLEANRLMMATRTPEENRRNTEAAHAIARVRDHTIEEKIKRAITRQRKGLHASVNETLMAQWLAERGTETVPQQAVHVYNVDLGSYPVAVEIFGGGWHTSGKHAATFRRRTEYLLNAGWNMVFVWVDRRDHPLRESCADYLITFIEQSRRDPSFRHQYRMVWGDGQPVPANSDKFNKLSLIPPGS